MYIYTVYIYSVYIYIIVTMSFTDSHSLTLYQPKIAVENLPSMGTLTSDVGALFTGMKGCVYVCVCMCAGTICMYVCMYSFVHWFIRSFIHPFSLGQSHSLIHLVLTYWLIHSFTHLFAITHSFKHSYIFLFIHSFRLMGDPRSCHPVRRYYSDFASLST